MGKRTSYLRTEGLALDEQLQKEDILDALSGVSLQECAKNCTERRECRSFQFHSELLECLLLAVNFSTPSPATAGHALRQNIRPLGPAKNMVAHFQRICISGEGHNRPACPSAYAFERFPQAVLLGHALEVLPRAGLSECLSACFGARRRLRMDCLSAMYFHGQGQCILNRQRRGTLPEGFFRQLEEVNGLPLVDYFENVCAEIVCSEGAELHWLQTEHFRMEPSREVLLLGKSLEECRQICIENQVHGVDFPCKAFVYASAKRQCQLSAQSGIVPSKQAGSRKKQRRHLKAEQLRPFAWTNSASSEQVQLESELSSFSSGQYFEKSCLESIEDLRESLDGQRKGYECGEEASFEVYPGKMLRIGQAQILPLKTLGECLWACLNAGDCRSAQTSKDECLLSAGTQLASPEAFLPSALSDYYENLCASITRSNFSSSSLSAKSAKNALHLASPSLDKRAATPERKQRPIMLESKVNETDEPSATNAGSKALLATDCRLSGIEVRAEFGTPSSGTLFLRDHSATCSTKFRKTLKASLPLQTPLDSPKCPAKELGPRHWSYIVVLRQENANTGGELEMDILTGQERVFNVTCDFSNTTTALAQNLSVPSSTEGPLAKASTDSAGQLPSHSPITPVPASLHMALLRNGQPVSAVSLGEELELRWNFGGQTGRWDEAGTVGLDGPAPRLAMSVQSCIAERLDGEPPEPPPLALIVDGCPDARVYSARLISSPIRRMPSGELQTRLKVFRFDGSRRVRIRCAVDICVEHCPPANCTADLEAEEEEPIGWEEGPDYGRRRRRSGREEEDGQARELGLTTLGELAELVQRYDRLRAGDDSREGEGQHVPALRKAESGSGGRRPGKAGEGGGGLLQQSTTISGSYTISEAGEEEAEDGQGNLANIAVGTRPTALARGRERGQGRAEEGQGLALVGLLKSGQMKPRGGGQEEQEGATAFLGLKRKGGREQGPGSEEETSSGAALCQGSSASSTSTTCVSRPLAILGLIFLIMLGTLQAYQLVQQIRRQIAKGRRKANGFLGPAFGRLQPLAPRLKRNSLEELGDGKVAFRHTRSNAVCLPRGEEEEEEQPSWCDCPRHFCQCQGTGAVEQNRRQSSLSVGTPTIARPVAQPRQTVFPAQAMASRAAGASTFPFSR